MEKDLRKIAIELYLKGESPKTIYSDLSRSKNWFFQMAQTVPKRRSKLVYRSLQGSFEQAFGHQSGSQKTDRADKAEFRKAEICSDRAVCHKMGACQSCPPSTF